MKNDRVCNIYGGLLSLIISLLLVACSSGGNDPIFRGVEWLSSPEDVKKIENVTLHQDYSDSKRCPLVLCGMAGDEKIWYGFQNNKLVIAGYIIASYSAFGDHSSFNPNPCSSVIEFLGIDSALTMKYGKADSIQADTTIRLDGLPPRSMRFKSVWHIRNVTIEHWMHQDDDNGSFTYSLYHDVEYRSKWFREIEKY
jgi:hypothetical protein